MLQKSLLILFLCFVITGCSRKKEAPLVTNVVTADIQRGIEAYIEKKTKEGSGYFRFSVDGKEYAFKLVRVHTEYLARLGEGRYFACVDLVDTIGDVYDTDFFLAGKPGAMTVTECSLHKLNGIPFFLWKHLPNGVWKQVPIKGARPQLLGVIRNRDEFEFLYRVKLPQINGSAKMWLPFPASDEFQKVTIKKIESPKQYKILNETKYGNKVLFFEFNSEDSNKTVDLLYDVTRFEKSAYPAEPDNLNKYLNANLLGPVDENFKTIAEEVVRGKKGDLVRARALFDHVNERMKYIKYGDGWGKGDAVYACNALSGNCTDFHAYFISLARSIGIPARFAIGAAIPSARNDGGVDGYHCWAEFYAEEKWWPIDISESNKYAPLSTYYFGHHPANRFEFSKGRDLVVDPLPNSGPINFLAYPVFEVNGKIEKPKVKFYFKRKTI